MQHNTYDLELHKWVLATFNDTWGNPSWRVGQVPEPAQPQIAEQPEPLPPSPPLELAQLLKCGFGRLFASASDSCNQHANARTGPGAGGARGGGGANVRRSLQSWEETSLQSWEETSLQSSQGTSAPLAGLDASRGRRRTRSSVREMTVYLHLHKSAGTSVRAHSAALLSPAAFRTTCRSRLASQWVSLKKHVAPDLSLRADV
jgi:hypothetical protein